MYDGDTPQQQRPLIRDSAQLLITNPDMLHQSILPFHNNFRRLLSKLTYVVVDEVKRVEGEVQGSQRSKTKAVAWAAVMTTAECCY